METWDSQISQVHIHICHIDLATKADESLEKGPY